MKTVAGIALLLIASALLEIGSWFTPILGTFSTIIKLVSYAFFLYKRIPPLLNRRLKTTIFTHDHLLRWGIACAPFLLFSLLALGTPSLIIPTVFSGVGFQVIDLSLFASAALGAVFFLSVLFGWRLWKKHPSAVEDFYKRIEPWESQIDVDYFKKGGVRRAYANWALGLLISVLPLIFFLFWLFTYVVDYVYIGFIGAWLIYEIFLDKKTLKTSKKIGNVLVQAEEVEKHSIFWEAFVLPTTCGHLGVSALLLIAFSIMFPCGLIVVAVGQGFPTLIFAWVLFFGWYLLLLSIQISRRLNLKLASINERETKSVTFRVIPSENLAIFAISLFLVFMWATGNNYVLFWVLPLFTPSLALAIFIFAFAITLYSGSKFFWRRNTSEERPIRRSYLIDKAKIAWLWIVGDLLLAVAFYDAVGIFLLLSGIVALFSFEADIKYVFPKMKPWKYGVVGASVGLITTAGLQAVLYLTSRMETNPQAWGPIMYPLAIIMSIISLLMGVGGYKDQQKRLSQRPQKE